MRGDENDPIYQSELSKYGFKPKGNAVWAKTALGSAIHEILRIRANNSQVTDEKDMEIEPMISTAFFKAILDLERQHQKVQFTDEDLVNPSKKEKQKRKLLNQGERILRKVRRIIDFSKLNIVGTELSFKFQHPTLGLWFAGSADLVLAVNPDKFSPRIKTPQDFYSPKVITDEQNLLPIIWDYKTTINHIPLQESVQHHIYALAALYGYWTRKAFYEKDKHKLNFEKCDDWFSFNQFAPFYYIYLWDLLSNSRPAFSTIVSAQKRKNKKPTVVKANGRNKITIIYAFQGAETLEIAKSESIEIVEQRTKEWLQQF